jgi:hypothetical protein
MKKIIKNIKKACQTHKEKEQKKFYEDVDKAYKKYMSEQAKRHGYKIEWKPEKVKVKRKILG